MKDSATPNTAMVCRQFISGSWGIRFSLQALAPAFLFFVPFGLAFPLVSQGPALAMAKDEIAEGFGDAEGKRDAHRLVFSA
jgi:hypothetical protein